MPNYEYAVYVLTGLFCVLTLLVAACIILLVKCYNRLETIFEGVTSNLEAIKNSHKDLLLVMRDVGQLHRIFRETDNKIDDIIEDLNEMYLDKKCKDVQKTPEFEKIGSSAANASESLKMLEDAVYLQKGFEDGVKDGLRRCPDDSELDVVMISKEEYMFGNTQEYSKFKLWYNPESNTLRYTKTIFDFADFNAVNASTFLGDGLWYFGVNSGLEPNIIYIRNNRLKADFMIEKPKEKMNDGVGDQEN